MNASLRYEINDNNVLRVAYTFDRGRHRQTGETGFLQPNGEPFDVFPVNDRSRSTTGDILQKRDRLSIALLHQISGEYRGEFFDSRLTVNAGVRAPFFTRDLTNNCATSSASGFVECFGTNTAGLASYLATNTVNIGGGVLRAPQGPQHRVLHYNAILPNVGFVYDIAPRLSIFASYSRGLQVPSTDILYNSFFYPAGTAQAQPEPETTDNFDVGVRYRIEHDPGPARRLVHDLQEPACLGLRSRSRPERVPQPRHGQPIRHRRGASTTGRSRS